MSTKKEQAKKKPVKKPVKKVAKKKTPVIPKRTMKRIKRMIPTSQCIMLDTVIDSTTYANFIDFVGNLRSNKKDMGFIIINSPGGCVNTLLAIADMIKYTKDINFITVATGQAYSAAFDVWMMGDLRWALGTSDFMNHRGSGGYNTEATMNGFNTLEKRLDNIIKMCYSTSGLKKKDIKELFFTTDKFFSTKQMFDIGLVDEVITPVFV